MTAAPAVSQLDTRVMKGGKLLPFATPNYGGYYTNMLTPGEVVFAPDLSYAYVADWELFLVQQFGGQYGDKVGLIRDPFNLQGKQQYLGATTPIGDLAAGLQCHQHDSEHRLLHQRHGVPLGGPPGRLLLHAGQDRGQIEGHDRPIERAVYGFR